MRRELPWVPIEKPYVFDTDEGPKTLADLFDGRSQLLVHHFMFAPEWEAGCEGCSLLADHFDGGMVHLNQRDVTMVCLLGGQRLQLRLRRLIHPRAAGERRRVQLPVVRRPRGRRPRTELVRARRRRRLPRLLELRPRNRRLQHLLPAARPRPKGTRRGRLAQGRGRVVVAPPR